MRGYQKRVVFLKNPRSDIFEEAYFIIKEDSGEPVGDGIVNEAKRIINENRKIKAKRSRAPRLSERALFFGAGFFSATLIFITVLLLI